MNRIEIAIAGACAVAAGALAAPSLAQYNVATNTEGEQIVVIGHYGTAPSSVRSLSQAVSYSDLDLSTAAGRDELQHRVKLTARYLCDKLGEPAGSSGVTPSCRDSASGDAMTQVSAVERNFPPRPSTWSHGSVWQAPYPSDWNSRYP
jgi:UrcA family protein